MGAIHFSNKLSEPVHVVIAPNGDWVVADVITSFASGGGALFKGLTTINKVWRGIHLARAAGSLGGGVAKIAKFFEEEGTRIEPGETKLIFSTDWNDPLHYLSYLSPSGWGALAGASVKSIMVATKGMKQMLRFNSGDDESWISTHNAVVRAKHGSLFQEDYDEGFHPWYSGIALPSYREAERYAEASVGTRATGSRAVISNNTGFDLKLVDSHSWTGEFRIQPPLVLPAGMHAPVIQFRPFTDYEQCAGAFIMRIEEARCDIFCGTITRFSLFEENKTCTAIKEKGTWWAADSKSHMLDVMDDADYETSARGFNHRCDAKTHVGEMPRVTFSIKTT